MGMFRGCDREGMFRGSDRDLLLATVPKVGKSTGRNQRFLHLLRDMGCENLMLRSTRSRKFFCIVPSKDCLSNSAAAADANAEQRFLFYSCSKRMKKHKTVR